MYRRLFDVPPAALAAATASVVLLSTLAPVAEASFARKLSGKVSRNPSVGTQQLTADPPETIDGTISVFYDPSAVSLYFPDDPLTVESALFVDSPGFSSTVLIGVTQDSESEPVRFIDRGDFLDTGAPRPEAGELRVSFTRLSGAVSPVVLPPEPGYGGYVTPPNFEQGDDLFGVIFYELASYAQVDTGPDGAPMREVIPDAEPTITPFSLSVTPGETLRIIEEGMTTPTTLGPDEVTPGVIAFPEPGALGLLAIAGLALAARRRRE